MEHRRAHRRETKPNLLSSNQLLPHGTAAILDHLELGCGGNKCAVLVNILMNFICFSRLNSRGSGYQQEGTLSWQQKATWGLLLEANGGNVCTLLEFWGLFVMILSS